MTEEVLQAAILKLRSKALEQYAIIKDLYHQPTNIQTVDLIAQHALNLAQIEGAVITLEQYSNSLSVLTDKEKAASVIEEAAEDEPDDSTSSHGIGHEELMERSSTYRKSVGSDGES